jgi:hypothetical protein
MSRSLESPLSFRVRQPRGYVVNKCLDLINSLLYTLPQILSVGRPSPNTSSKPVKRAANAMIRASVLILGGHPPKPDFWGP